MRSILIALVLSAVTAMPAAVVFDSSFECGNGTNFTLIGANEYSFEIEPDTASTDRQWFYFSVAGAQGQTLIFDLLNTNTTNVPEHWDLAWPVASSDGGVTWSQTTGTPSHSANTFTFSHLIGADPELIAFHYPYTLTRAQAMIVSWEAHADVTHSVIGTSTQGRDIDLLSVTDATSNPLGGKRGFWIVARQHAAEVTGSWMVEGFVDFLLSSDPRAVGLRELAVIQVVPMMNPDGVFAGNYRNNALGFNLNREWDAPSAINSPELLAVTDEIAAWVVGGNSYDFFADIHSTSGGTSNFAFHSSLSVEPPLYPDPPDYSDQLDIFLELIETEDPDFDADTGNSSSLDQSLSRQRQMLQYGVLAVLFEGTYNHTDYGPNSGQHMTPDRHRAIGEAFAIALQRYFFPSVPAELAVFVAE